MSQTPRVYLRFMGVADMTRPEPLRDGLYFYRQDDGRWEPMLVDGGVQYRLVLVYHNGEPQLVSDFAATVIGPLVRPQVKP